MLRDGSLNLILSIMGAMFQALAVFAFYRNGLRILALPAMLGTTFFSNCLYLAGIFGFWKGWAGWIMLGIQIAAAGEAILKVTFTMKRRKALRWFALHLGLAALAIPFVLRLHYSRGILVHLACMLALLACVWASTEYPLLMVLHVNTGLMCLWCASNLVADSPRLGWFEADALKKAVHAACSICWFECARFIQARWPYADSSYSLASGSLPSNPENDRLAS